MVDLVERMRQKARVLNRRIRLFREEHEKRQHAERQVAALRGVITKMKRKAERQE